VIYKSLSHSSDLMIGLSSIVNNVSVFIERSAKRHALFENLQREEKKRILKSFCATRWSSRYLAFKAFVKLYKYLLTFLEIYYDENDIAIVAAARGFQKQEKSFNFVFYYNILFLLFEKHICFLSFYRNLTLIKFKR
jgi:phosphopantetheinyl transferase (holo-ACP synthase)